MYKNCVIEQGTLIKFITSFIVVKHDAELTYASTYVDDIAIILFVRHHKSLYNEHDIFYVFLHGAIYSFQSIKFSTHFKVL